MNSLVEEVTGDTSALLQEKPGNLGKWPEMRKRTVGMEKKKKSGEVAHWNPFLLAFAPSVSSQTHSWGVK